MLRIAAILTTVAVAVFMAWVIGQSITGWEAAEAPGIDLDPDEVPPRLQPDQEATTLEQMPNPGSGEREWVQRIDPQTHRVTHEFFYARMDPLPDGQYEVQGQIARFFPAPNRAVVMTADAGRITAPDRIPQAGRFSGNVVVRLFEAAPGERPRLVPESPDLALTILMDHVRFDTQVGMIETDGPVTVLSDNAEFKGRRMRLVFNEPEQRVDYLEITHGQYLKYRPSEPEGEAGRRAVVSDRIPAARNRRALDMSASDQPPGSNGRPAADAPDEPTDERITYYRAVFSDDVRLTGEDRRIFADKMTAYFAFQGDAADDRAAKRPAKRHDAARTHPATRRDPPPNALVSAAENAGIPAAPNGEQLVMTWSGKMVITPTDKRPARLAGPDDLRAVFEGAPVRAEGDGGERMTAAAMAYRASGGEISAEGSAAFPLRMRSARLGRIQAETLTLRLDTGEGTLRGAGTLEAIEPDHAPADRTGERGLPAGFRVHWNDRLDLQLATGAEPDGLKRATFHGAVDVNDRRFDLNAEQLAVVFDQIDADGERQLSRINAQRDVRVRSADGALDADRMRIDVALNAAGELQPRHLDAAGDVRIADDTQRIEAQLLLATFARDRAGTRAGQTSAEDDDAPALRLATVDARERVVLNLKDGTVVRTDRLEADNQAGTATLTGKPVVIDRRTSQLRVPRLVVRRDGSEAVARGRGSFALNEPPDDAHPAGRRIDVTWSDRMTYSDRDDELTVIGNVRARAQDKPRERNELDADRVTLDLLDRGAVARTGEDAPPESAMLQAMEATGNVRLLSTRYRDEAMNDVQTRLRISGEHLTFDNVAEQARVDEAGTLLIEDYRPVDESDADRVAASEVKISGRGQTVFTWTGGMHLDGARTDAIFRGNVHMTHKPRNRNAVVELKTEELIADMEGLGGLEALNTTDELNIRRIRATGRTQLTERGADPGRMRLISTHLLDYDGQTNEVLLEARPGHRVEIIRLDEPRPVRAARIRWHLDTDRIEIQDSAY